LVRQLKDMNVRAILLNGLGEPFMNPNILSFIEEIRKNSIMSFVMTPIKQAFLKLE